MKNITLSVDEQVLVAARRYAAQHHTSLNGLVREYLADIARRQDTAASVRQRLRLLSEQSGARIGTRRPGREELHERR